MVINDFAIYHCEPIVVVSLPDVRMTTRRDDRKESRAACFKSLVHVRHGLLRPMGKSSFLGLNLV